MTVRDRTHDAPWTPISKSDKRPVSQDSLVLAVTRSALTRTRDIAAVAALLVTGVRGADAPRCSPLAGALLLIAVARRGVDDPLPRRAPVRLVRGARARDGAARAGARGGDRASATVARRRRAAGTRWRTALVERGDVRGVPAARRRAAAAGADASDPIAFAAAVVLVFMLTNALNFPSVAAYLHLRGVLSVREAFGTVYRTMLPFELATALLTAGVAFTLRPPRDRRARRCSPSSWSSSTTSRARPWPRTIAARSSRGAPRSSGRCRSACSRP